MASSRIAIFQNWISNYVIGLNLCPFAKLPMENEEVQYKLTSNNLDRNELIEFLNEFSRESNRFVSIFLVFSKDLSYQDYLEFYYEVEDNIDSIEAYLDLKAVGFHPEYLHGGVDGKTIHYSNRSPVPAIQLLRNSYVGKTTNEKLVASILKNNEKTLSEIGVIKLQEIINESKK